jgi:hypothetical protein
MPFLMDSAREAARVRHQLRVNAVRTVEEIAEAAGVEIAVAQLVMANAGHGRDA